MLSSPVSSFLRAIDCHLCSEYLATGTDDKKEWVRSGIAASTQQLKEAGYDVDFLLFQMGEGVEALEAKLKEGKWDGVIVGMSLRIAS
jgi:hypothetical protein